MKGRMDNHGAIGLRRATTARGPANANSKKAKWTRVVTFVGVVGSWRRCRHLGRGGRRLIRRNDSRRYDYRTVKVVAYQLSNDSKWETTSLKVKDGIEFPIRRKSSLF